VISGYGIHSGSRSKVFFHLEDGPIRFYKNNTYIPANLDSVVATPRCTVLGKNNQNIAVVEHLLASLHAHNYWSGLVIEVIGDELPILDGSAKAWFEALGDINLKPKIPQAIILKQGVEYNHLNTAIKAIPAKHSLQVNVDYDHPAIGQQSWRGGHLDYKELQTARTFGFLKEAEALKKAGLARRAELENVIIFDDVGAMQKLRFKNEIVRHKALDATGDFFLLARPLEAKITISRGSHESHIAFLRLLRQSL